MEELDHSSNKTPNHLKAMAISKSFSFLSNVSFLVLILLPLSLSSVTFILDEFQPNMKELVFEGDAHVSKDVLQLTKNLPNSIGHATYFHPIILWNNTTVADWVTEFSFIIKASDNKQLHGDGFSFFLAPTDFGIPANNTESGYLGLFDKTNSYKKKILAVEFDTFQNSWDPSSSHIGVDINSISSVVTANITSKLNDHLVGSSVSALVRYNSTTKVLSASLTPLNDKGNGKGYNIATLSYPFDLNEILPQVVKVGFSAATGALVETHGITSWNFFSSM